MRKRGFLFTALAVVLLVGSSPLAAAPTIIKRGIDVFTTTDNGKTFYDFAKNPIPAGFFCNGSAAFTGRVVFKGLPLQVAEGYLRGADTVIERLDDAVFNARGTAATRIRFRALSLVSIEPIRTSCGAFYVYASLPGKQAQQSTTMNIYRTRDGGGTFSAPLAVNVRLTFIAEKPDKGLSVIPRPRKLELTGSFTFPATSFPWSTQGGPRTKQIGSVVVDTNGDLTPDTRLRGTSNFWPGWSPDGVATKIGGQCPGGGIVCEPETCHTDPSTGKQHCTGPVIACGNFHCP